MRNIINMAAAAICIITLTACGGGGDDGNGSTLNRADEGIWSNLNSGTTGQYGIQSVILSDGSYWGLYGQNKNGAFIPENVLQGAASVNNGSVSGTYTNLSSAPDLFNGTYSGTVSPQNKLNLTFNDPSDTLISTPGSNSFNMSYDNIYNQPASLSAIAGNYQGNDCAINISGVTEVCGFSSQPAAINGNAPATPLLLNLTISGSNLTVSNPAVTTGSSEMNGTLAPHGTTVNVFDVNLTPGAAADPNVLPAERIYKGILFETSSGTIEIIATSGSNAYYYIGSK